MRLFLIADGPLGREVAALAREAGHALTTLWLDEAEGEGPLGSRVPRGHREPEHVAEGAGVARGDRACDLELPRGQHRLG